MAALRTSLFALWCAGCFVDAVGLPSAAGGDAAGGAAPVAGGPLGGSGAGLGGATPSGGGATGGGSPVRQECPQGQLVATIDSAGVIACAPVVAETLTAINSSCAVHYGWRDNCDNGCTDGPSEWGKVSATSCAPNGSESTCQVVDLGTSLQVPLFGVEPEGNVDGADRFYSAFSCATGSAGAAPCENGTFVTGYDGETADCAPLSGAVLDYVRPSCSLVTAWRDQCGNCESDPQKYAFSTTLGCDTGLLGSCGTPMLGADTIQMASFDVDGNVDDDDKFYVGLRCAETPTSVTVPTANSCAQGQFVAGIAEDGALLCRGLDDLVMRAFRDRCTLYFGWRDNCHACTDPPAKWGSVRDGTCTLGVGQDDTCTKLMVGGQEVALFGLNTDSDVDNGDKFYIGFRCE